MKVLTLFIGLFLFGNIHLSAQSFNTELEQLNGLTEYSNQNIHGLFIIHRLLELYNQDINQYVDLEGYKLNAFGNGDLPRDIFEDPNKEFYKVETPLSIYRKLQPKIRPELSTYLNGFNKLTKEANQMRWDIADFMVKADFSKGENVGKVYEMLETCVTIFEDYYVLRQDLNSYIKTRQSITSAKSKSASFLSLSQQLESIITIILHDIRTKKHTGVIEKVNIFSSLLGQLRAEGVPFGNNRTNTESFQRILERGEEFISYASDFGNQVALPKENQQYGSFYYYHNYKLLHRVNYSGVGMLYEFNELIKNNQVDATIFPEIPHYFKVIYPERKANVAAIENYQSEKVVELTNAKIIYDLPTTMEGRNVEVTQIDIENNDLRSLTFELYDHKLLDGDVVSINFNGDWVLKNHSLEEEPLKLIVQANQEGKNYLLVHAENEGSKPPNTLAIKYRPKKKKKEILLSCNTQTSQLIEINFK